MVIMVTTISRGTIVRSWGSFKHRALAALNRASAYFVTRVGGFFDRCRYTALTVASLSGLGGHDGGWIRLEMTNAAWKYGQSEQHK